MNRLEAANGVILRLVHLKSLVTSMIFNGHIIKKGTPLDKPVTSTNTVCDALNSNHVFKDRLPDTPFVQNNTCYFSYIRMYIFSLQRLLLTFALQMRERRLNNCLLLHVHNAVATEFVCAHDERKKIFSLCLHEY